MFSKRLNMMEDSEIVEDLICTGCKLCSTPIDSGYADATISLAVF